MLNSRARFLAGALGLCVWVGTCWSWFGGAVACAEDGASLRETPAAPVSVCTDPALWVDALTFESGRVRELRLHNGRKLSWNVLSQGMHYVPPALDSGLAQLQIVSSSETAVAREPVPAAFLAPGDELWSQNGKLCWRPRLVSGRLHDLRYGEVLLGEEILRADSQMQLRVDGVPVEASQLDKYIGCQAWARCAPHSGAIRVLDLLTASGDRSASQKEGPAALITGLAMGVLDKNSTLPFCNGAYQCGAGRRLRFTMQAASGGRAEFCVPGWLPSCVAREVAPGRYEAHITVPVGLDVPHTRLLGRFCPKGGSGGSWRRGPQLNVAGSVPYVSSLGWADGCGQAACYGAFANYGSRGSLVDAQAVRLYLDGREVTFASRRTVYACMYQAQECDAAMQAAFRRAGEHTLRLRLKDCAGNEVVYQWNSCFK